MVAGKQLLQIFRRNIFWFWLLLLTVLNLLQSGYTELFDDEAYYWMYSRYLSWGYFDHPPMVALIIKAGYLLFHNEFGIRFVSVLLISACILLMHRLMKPVDNKRFVCIIFSLGFLQIGGMFITPDVPLLFFTACFFYLFRVFLQNQGWRTSVGMGVIMAALLYSKYHGILVIVFTMLANPFLFRNKQWWVALCLCLLLYMPHIYWQYANGFPSIKYHLVDRTESYHYFYTTDYLVGLLFIFGPLAGWFFLYAVVTIKTGHDTWIKTLKWNVVGILIFFFFCTFKGWVQANWTVVAFVPAVLLLQYYLESTTSLNKLLAKLLPYSLFVVLIVRLGFVYDFSDNYIYKFKEIHNNKIWVQSIKMNAKGYPVLFMDTYQIASKYSFYSSQQTSSFTTVGSRSNQYDIWNIEKKWHQDSILVVIVNNNPFIQCDSLSFSSGKLYYKMFANPNLSPNIYFMQLFHK